MTTFTDLGVTCQKCNKEYPDEPKLEGEYTCPRCQTIDTIESLLNQSQNKLNYDMDRTDVIIIRENLSIIDSWLDDVVYLLNKKS